MCCFHVEKDDAFGFFEARISQMSREDAIALANLLRESDNNYLREFGLEIEAELMTMNE